jgi:transposase
MLLPLPTPIVFNMGRRLPDEVVHRITLRIEANEDVAAIAEAVKVSKKTIYKLRLNMDIWGKPYAPATVTLGRPRLLLPYQELVTYNAI